MIVVDKEQLLAWLRETAEKRHGLVQGAIYLGLAARIERGDFDVLDDRPTDADYLAAYPNGEGL